MFLGAVGAVRGGGARPEAAGAPGRGREEEPPAEGARSQGEAVPEERSQGGAQGGAGGPGAAGEAEGHGEEGGPPPQRRDPGGDPAGGLHECSNTAADAALTFRVCPQTATKLPTGLKPHRGVEETAGQSLCKDIYHTSKTFIYILLLFCDTCNFIPLSKNK